MSDDNNKDQFYDSTDEKGEIESENASNSELGSSIEEEEGKKLLEETSNDDKSGKQIIIDDEDGFKTPTSEEHRIPAMTECPPAPRKPRRSVLKRKRSSETPCRRRLQFDDLEEVESIFQPAVPDIEEGGQNVPASKKVRRDDDDIQW